MVVVDDEKWSLQSGREVGESGVADRLDGENCLIAATAPIVPYCAFALEDSVELAWAIVDAFHCD